MLQNICLRTLVTLFLAFLRIRSSFFFNFVLSTNLFLSGCYPPARSVYYPYMKILFFDYWLKGVSNFTRLMPEIKNQCPEAEVKMLHVGSWKEHQAQPVNNHGDFSSFDISYYNSSFIYKVLKKERPDVVVMLNIYLLLDKAMIAFCKKMGIRVVFLSHGRLSQADANSKSSQANPKKKSLKSKLKKEPFLTLLNYAHGTLLTGNLFQLFKTVGKMVKNKFSIVFPSLFNSELDADEMLVYYDSDRKLLVKDKNFPENKIKVIGNPELDDFVNLPVMEKEEFKKVAAIEDKPYLLYLDDGWVENGMIPKKDWIDHITEINTLAEKAGLNLVIKLHPRTKPEEFRDFFNEKGIKAFKKEVDFKSLIHYSQVVSSLASTTISMALFLNKRVISPRFGKVEEVFLNYPEDVIHYSKTPQDFLDFISSEKPSAINQKYLEDNFSQCDGKVISRIVKNIIGEK